ncbi:MAG: YIP1 family protein [Candidatus Nanoarchaeia archaeon]|nr:YIP1 family protein [Candidatus Nanoarchaeia archaeon]
MKISEYFKRLYEILNGPKKAIEKYKDDNKISDPFFFLLFTIILFELFNILISVIIKTDLKIIIFNFLLSFIYEFIGLIFSSALIHLIFNLLGCKKGFIQTFKVYSYLSSFLLLNFIISFGSKFFPFIIFGNIILGVWIFSLSINLLSKFNEISSKKVFGAYWIIMFIFIIISIILGINLINMILN